MYNFDSYNVLLSIATNIPVLLMTAFVLQGHIYLLERENSLVLGMSPYFYRLMENVLLVVWWIVMTQMSMLEKHCLCWSCKYSLCETPHAVQHSAAIFKIMISDYIVLTQSFIIAPRLWLLWFGPYFKKRRSPRQRERERKITDSLSCFSSEGN